MNRGLTDPFRAWRGPLTSSRAEPPLRCLLLAIYLLLIFLASSLPTSELPAIRIDDRISHTLAYFVLGMVTLFAGAGLLRDGLVRRHYILAALFDFTFALSDEFHQAFVPTREPSLKDLFFDTVGLTVAIMVIARVMRKRP